MVAPDLIDQGDQLFLLFQLIFTTLQHLMKGLFAYG
jgi:hypothetical protein